MHPAHRSRTSPFPPFGLWLAVLLAGVGWGPAALAGTVTVTTTADEISSDGADLNSTGGLDVTGFGGLTITPDLMANTATTDADDFDRVLDVRTGPTTLIDLIIADGPTAAGGLSSAPTTGSITIVKSASTEDDTAFNFTSSIPGGATFTLMDPSDNTEVFTGVAPGTYNVSEIVPADWDLASIDCGANQNNLPAIDGINIVLEAGEDVTCTFNNVYLLGSITIVKSAMPEDDTAFDFTSSIPGGATFTLMDPSDNTEVFTGVPAGTYNVTEVVPANWDLVSIDCGANQNNIPAIDGINIVLEAGEDVTCTFNNVDLRGSITIVKSAMPEDGTDFSFTIGGGLSPASFTLDDDTDPTFSNTEVFTGVSPGTYNVSEIVPANWDLVSIDCGANQNNIPAIDGINIVLEAGEDVTCTFNNSRIDLVINEVDYDQGAVDNAEFIELKNTGATDIDLSDYQLKLVRQEAGGAVAYNTIPLTGTLAAGAYFVVCADPALFFPGTCDLDTTPNVDLIADADGGTVTGTAVRLEHTATTTAIDAVAFEGAVNGSSESTPVTPGDDATTRFAGLSRNPDGGDTNDNDTDFAFRCVTPGGVNTNSMDTSACRNPLPVELSAFEATRDGEAVMLAWQTASETNNAGFEVQQAHLAEEDAATERAWQLVTFVEGAGTTTAPQAYSHRIEAMAPGRYAFRLKQIDFDGAFAFSPEVEVEIEVPRALSLSPNYPNPFNPQATIQFTVPADGKAMLTVYNVLGQEVAVLFDGLAQAGKQHEVTFEAGTLATGLYVYTLEHGGRRLSRTLMLMK